MGHIKGGKTCKHNNKEAHIINWCFLGIIQCDDENLELFSLF